MRRVVIPCVLSLLGFACARAPAEIAEPATEPAAEPAAVFVEARPLECDGTLLAIIGERGLEITEFERIYAMKEQKYADRGREVPTTAARRYHLSIAERLIYQELLALETAKQGVDYDQAALSKREQSQKRGIEDWDEHLRRRGEDEASLRALYEAELRERALLEQAGSLEITDEELLAEYEKIKSDYDRDAPRIRAAHILIEVDDDTSEAEALARAEAAYRAALLPETDFAELARSESDGPSRSKGGDLGIFSADRMVEEFSKVAFKLKPGEVSPPVKTKFGYHVIKVHGVWGPGQLPLEALEPSIRERLVARKLHLARRELKQQLFDEYKPISCIEDILEMHGLPGGPFPTSSRSRAETDSDD